MRNKLLTAAIVVFITYKFRGPLTYFLMKHTDFRYTEDIRVSMSTEDFDEEQHGISIRYQMPGNLEVWTCPDCKIEILISWNETIEKFAITKMKGKVPIHRIGGIAFVWPDIHTEKESNEEIPNETENIKRMLGDFGNHI